MLPDRIQASYVRALKGKFGPGEQISLQRGIGAGATTYPVAGWVTEYVPEDLEGAIEQGKRNAVLLASDVVASGFPLPILPKQDRVVWAGKTIAITAVDEATRRVQGVLIAYELELEGA